MPNGGLVCRVKLANLEALVAKLGEAIPAFVLICQQEDRELAGGGADFGVGMVHPEPADDLTLHPHCRLQSTSIGSQNLLLLASCIGSRRGTSPMAGRQQGHLTRVATWDGAKVSANQAGSGPD